MNEKQSEKEKDQWLANELGIDKQDLKALKKKLSKIEPRPERGVETLFRLVSGNHYTLSEMVDKKANILISINALILSITIGTVLSRLDADPHLIYPVVIMLGTNILSIAYAITATRPELQHGERGKENLMFFGNYQEMEEEEYVQGMMDLIYKGDELYATIARDTYHLGRSVNRQFRQLRYSFNVFLYGVILAVVGFILCHTLFT